MNQDRRNDLETKGGRPEPKLYPPTSSAHQSSSLVSILGGWDTIVGCIGRRSKFVWFVCEPGVYVYGGRAPEIRRNTSPLNHVALMSGI